MSVVYITSDLHLGHKSITRFRTEFSSQKEHEDCILNGILSTVRPRDVLYILGDCAFNQEGLNLLKAVPCRMRLILGNHDTDRSLNIKDWVGSGVFEEIHSLWKYKKAWLSHAPIHPQELRGRINIHGHVHQATIDDPRYVNVCVENTGYKPVNYQEIIKGTAYQCVEKGYIKVTS